jgi:hypothetical protein
MKALFFNIVFCAFFSFSCYGQNTNVKKNTLGVIVFNTNTQTSFSADELNKLEEVYGSALSTEILNRPTRVLGIKEILRNRVAVKKITNPNHQKPCPFLSEVPLFDAFVSSLKRDDFFDPTSFNPLKYNFPFHRKGYQMFRVDQTDYYILIKPQHYNKAP